MSKMYQKLLHMKVNIFTIATLSADNYHFLSKCHMRMYKKEYMYITNKQ